ncbi:MAG TPA: SDR family oxidoreductase [Sphingomicrobium sp.]|nr:SDR family oxidoreductase [Sphingomicrobium sp.]
MTPVAFSSNARRVIVIGAGRGIGQALAQAFHDNGAELVLGDSDAVALRSVQRKLGGLSRFCDVRSEASVEIFVQDVLANFDSFDMLINAAGEGYVRTLGAMRVSRAFLGAMRKFPHPKVIVNVAPDCGEQLEREAFPYAGSLEAFRGLTEALAHRTRGSSVSVMMALSATARSSPADRVGHSDQPANAYYVASDNPAEIALEAEKLLLRGNGQRWAGPLSSEIGAPSHEKAIEQPPQRRRRG